MKTVAIVICSLAAAVYVLSIWALCKQAKKNELAEEELMRSLDKECSDK